MLSKLRTQCQSQANPYSTTTSIPTLSLRYYVFLVSLLRRLLTRPLQIFIELIPILRRLLPIAHPPSDEIVVQEKAECAVERLFLGKRRPTWCC